MDLTLKRQALEAELVKVCEIRDRALAAANEATLQIAGLEGALALLDEIESSDG
jgi:hypothetical protein